ncbi:MAG TPA: YggS family pyridoxal phosphate-dependent enzyme [Phycisphaerae bacterium]
MRRVRDRIASACDRARRAPDSVKLVAVTKSVGIYTIRELLELGVTDVGESYVQELVRRAAMIREAIERIPLSGSLSAGAAVEPKWHLIGHLQRNKARSVMPWVTMIHSLDSLRLAEDLSSGAEKAGRRLDVLLQVNAGEESQKFGVPVAAATHMAEQIRSLPALRLCGLMCMAPLIDDQQRLRRIFVRVRELFEEIQTERLAGPAFEQLSMGMTQDFEIAIEEGATIVRVGSALFEGLEPSAKAPPA